MADEQTRLRYFFEFMRGADAAGSASLRFIGVEPSLTGDARFDALLAAVAEHVAARYAQPGPLWTITSDRFLRSAPWSS